LLRDEKDIGDEKDSWELSRPGLFSRPSLRDFTVNVEILSPAACAAYSFR